MSRSGIMGYTASEEVFFISLSLVDLKITTSYLSIW
jgi:hypothetical protein